jgi:hypothetical protein
MVIYCKIFFTILMLWSTTSFAAVKAQVDRLNLNELETLTLSIEISGNDNGEPEIAALEKDFEVLSRNHGSSYSLINGSVSSKSTWMIHLRPRHAGTLTIPALQVGSSTTQAITVQVSKAADRNDSGQGPTGNIWIDMQVEPKQVLVQQQAIVSVRIYQAAVLNQAQLTEPSPANVIIERLGEDANYQATRNGRTWHVLERRYALFPQQSGQIKIEPIQLDGSIIVRNSNFFSQLTRPVRLRSNAVTLDVLAMPSDWDSSEWLPATRVELIEDWPSATTFKVGEPVTRTLALRSEGLLSSQLPSVSSMLPDYLKAYPDKPKLSNDKTFEGVSGSRQEKVAIMPMQPGTYILPQIDIPWWNTETGQKEVATIPPRTFKVVAAAAAVKPALNQVEPEVKPLPAAQIPSKPVPGQSGWKWLALITSTGWLLTLGWLWISRKQGKRGEAGKDIRAASLKQARKSVELACKRKDAKACEQALLSFAQLRLDSSVNNLAALVDQCDSNLAREITSLEKCLYASGKKDWCGAGLLQAFQKADFKVSQPGAARQSVTLPDLYPD